MLSFITALSMQHGICRHVNPPSWSLRHLTRLTELTLSGDEDGEVMVDLMRSRPAPVLPASLRVLRQDNVEDINTLPQNKW